MAGDETTFDPIAAQLKALSPVAQAELKLDDLVNPQVVQFLIAQQLYTLYALKQSQNVANTVRKEAARLQLEREDLKVELAKKNERDSVSWIEIPISLLAGFAINMLTVDINNSLGWFLIGISLLIVSFLRFSSIRDILSNFSRKGKVNAQD